MGQQMTEIAPVTKSIVVEAIARGGVSPLHRQDRELVAARTHAPSQNAEP